MSETTDARSLVELLDEWDETTHDLARLVQMGALPVLPYDVDDYTFDAVADIETLIERVVEAANAGRQVLQAQSIAKRAINGWACYAKRKIEHDEIARLHREADALPQPTNTRAALTPLDDWAQLADVRQVVLSTPQGRHQWKTQRQGGDPAEATSYERVTSCERCGVELTDANRYEVCS